MNRLKKVGFTQEQAEVHAQIVTEINESGLATKQDVKDLSQNTESEFALLRKDLELFRAENKKDLETLKFDLTARITVIFTSALAALTAIQKFLL
ncbi:MAG: hypothetical protein KA100_02800 [Rickettsiales bacterium]|nr:hypothetical protein [Rickettsiales bacterium]